MRILHTSDWHAGKTLRGRSRLDEQARVLAEIVEIAGREQADLVIVAGDLFDTAAPSPEAERLVYSTLLGLSATGAAVAVLSGNHDSDRRLQAVEPLLALGKVQVRPMPAAAATLAVDARDGSRAVVAMLPWVGKHHLIRAEALMRLDAAEAEQQFASRLGRIVEAVCAPMGEDTVNILAAHLTIVGAEPGDDVRQAHVYDYAIPASVFPSSLHYVALGHFHRPQRVAAPCPAWYCGAPMWLGFPSRDDESHAKGVVVVDAVAGAPAETRFVEIAAARRLRTIRGTLDELEALAGSTGDDYLRVYVREQARAGIAKQVREWFPDAVDVQIDAGDAAATTTRPARAGRSPHELFVEYLTEQQALDERVVALFDRFAEEMHASDPA